TNGDPEETDTNGTTSTTTTTTTTTTAPPVVTHLPGEVKVAVMNGTGVRGRAGRTADALNATGFVTAAKNTQQDRVEASVIYYRPGYGDDAKSVASVLGAPPDIITPAPGTIMTLIRNPGEPADLEEFNIFAVVGTDDVILDRDPPADSG
ncbi:MAG: LytR family transcriptional regulator, partial [Acidimicrobiaceae bacterium]|nr:LytR family transcriptional regulator [Acidimicrobiaceae bacterium]